MKHVPLTTGRPVAFETELQAPRQRKGVFETIFEAMHYSRRLQAERTLYQYRHLIGEANSDIYGEPRGNQKPEIMTESEKQSRHDRLRQLRAHSATMSIGIVVIAFIVLHVVGGTILHGSSQQENISDDILSRGFD